MRVRTSTSPTRRRGIRVASCLGAVALATAPLVLATGGTASAATPFLKSANVANYSGVLENSAARSLYALSTEKGAALHCKTSCLSTWVPLLVKSSVKSVAVGPGVKGKVGFVRRSATRKQVTFNTYPLYTYVGDSGPNQSTGEAIASDGGVWHLVHAGARTAAATSYAPILNSANIPSYAGVLESTSSRSIYVLSAEKGGTLHCTGGCASIWPPLLVTSTTTSISLGNGVKGTIGFVARGAKKQVTFNSYPVYTYTGDNGANQSNGEGIVADGGTWTLASAAATTAGGTPVPPAAGGGGWSRSPR